MYLFLSFALYALVVTYALWRSAWLRNNLQTWAQNALLAGQIGVVVTIQAVRLFVTYLFGIVLTYGAVLIVAIFIGNKIFLFVWFLLAILLLTGPMVALYLLSQPASAVTDRLERAGQWAWNLIPAYLPLPANLNPATATGFLEGFWRLLSSPVYAGFNSVYMLAALPLKLIGGILFMIGWVARFAVDTARWMARVAAAVAGLFLVLAALTLLDIQMGWNMVNPFTMMIVGLVGVGLMVLHVLNQTHSSGVWKIITVTAMLAFVLAGVAEYVGWLAAWQATNIYLFHPAFALCIILSFLILASIYHHLTKHEEAIDEHGHGHGWTKGKHVVAKVAMLAAVWFLLWPWFLKGEPPYVWTQRLVHFQFSRLHAVNTTQAKTETEPTVSDAETTGQVPSAETVRASFRPSSRRAKDLTDEQRAWDASASGADTNERAPYIDVKLPWSNPCVPFYQPLRVQASGHVTNLRNHLRNDTTPRRTVPPDGGYEKVGPDGTDRNGVGDGYELPVADDAHYLALIGRVYDGDAKKHSAPFLVGSRMGGAVGGFFYSHEPVGGNK
jgi:hypothetical protein